MSNKSFRRVFFFFLFSFFGREKIPKKKKKKKKKKIHKNKKRNEKISNQTRITGPPFLYFLLGFFVVCFGNNLMDLFLYYCYYFVFVGYILLGLLSSPPNMALDKQGKSCRLAMPSSDEF